MNTNRFLSISELADYLNISVDTIYFWVYQKSIPFYKVGRHLRFRVEEIEEWLKKRRTIVMSLYIFR